MTQDEKMKGIVTASGKVVGDAEIKTTAGDLHDLVKLQRTNGDTVVVDLGVGGPQVEKGDQLFVHGTAARISGKPVIFARYVAELQPAGMAGAAGASAGGTREHDSEAQRDAGDDVGDEGLFDV